MEENKFKIYSEDHYLYKAILTIKLNPIIIK